MVVVGCVAVPVMEVLVAGCVVIDVCVLGTV